MSVYRRTFVYFRPFAAPSMLALVLTLGVIGLNLLKPWPLRYIIDGVLSPVSPSTEAAHTQLDVWFGGMSPAGVVLALCAILVGVTFLSGLVNLAANTIFVHVGLRSLLKIRTELYAYLQSLPLKYHDARRSSDSSFRVAYDSQAIQTIYNRGFSNILSSGVMLVATFVVMAWMDWKLTLWSLAVVPLVVVAIHFYAVRIRAQSTVIQERESDVLATAQEGLSSIRMIHAFGREEFEVGQFQRRAAESLQANMRLTVTNVSSALVIGTLMAVGTAVLYYVGSLQVLGGALSLGELTVFAAYLVMLYQPLEQLTYTAWAMEGAAAGAKRCFEVLDRADEVSDAPDARPLGDARGALAFEAVDFAYREDQPILKNISLAIAPGQSVAFVGGTGAGKSTLLSLVPRFYDPTRGAVKMDGHDLRSLTKKSVRAQVSMVLQDTLLFSTTVRENIAYGRPDATEEEIVEAAERAQARDFIMRMPEGFSSQVGERGGHLSVGQRQRIGMARAFLKNAPILLLDEPTSALDPATEHAIMETIEELMRGRTTLIITHRLATVHRMERIVVMRHGEIAEEGAGAELLARGGVYAEMYRAGRYDL